jgi:hypothetical protein
MKFVKFKTKHERAIIAIRADLITSVYEEASDETCITFANDETQIVAEPINCVLSKIEEVLNV